MSEAALLEAVRHQLINVCGYSEQQCAIEIDEETPAVVGDVYVIVAPGGCAPGPVNDTSGGVLDELHSVNVTVIMRATSVPKDRTRNFLLDNLGGLNARLRKIINAIQFNYDVNNHANSIIGEQEEGFVEPLRFYGMSAPTMAPAERLSARGPEPRAAIQRMVTFNKARRIQNIGASAT